VYGYIKTPEEVGRIANGIYADARNDGEIAVLYRYLHDMRMDKVWKQLMAEKRGMPGVFQLPAVGGAISPGGPALAQQRACGKVLSGAFYAICIRGQLQVSKWSEEEESRKKVLAGPAESRRVADKLAAHALVDPGANGAAATALRMAQVEEEVARLTIAQMRTRDDPLVISKDRGDRTARGVATAISDKLNELFGAQLYGIAAILAGVGLGEEVSKQVVRSAFGPRKSIAKKSKT
jgi:hypothetical protein